MHAAGKHPQAKTFQEVHVGKNDTDVGVNAREMRRMVTRSASMISISRKHPVVSKNVYYYESH